MEALRQELGKEVRARLMGGRLVRRLSGAELGPPIILSVKRPCFLLPLAHLPLQLTGSLLPFLTIPFPHTLLHQSCRELPKFKVGMSRDHSLERKPETVKCTGMPHHRKYSRNIHTAFRKLSEGMPIPSSRARTPPKRTVQNLEGQAALCMEDGLGKGIKPARRMFKKYPVKGVDS